MGGCSNGREGVGRRSRNVVSLLLYPYPCSSSPCPPPRLTAACDALCVMAPSCMPYGLSEAVSKHTIDWGVACAPQAQPTSLLIMTRKVLSTHILVSDCTRPPRPPCKRLARSSGCMDEWVAATCRQPFSSTHGARACASHHIRSCCRSRVLCATDKVSMMDRMQTKYAPTTIALNAFPGDASTKIS
jgi:hypothetical protein